MNDDRFKYVDLTSLMKRLTALALSWFRREGYGYEGSVLPNTGISPEDLACNAIAEFVEEVLEKPLRWKLNDPHENLFPYIEKIMRHDFLDLVKDGRAYKRTVIPNPKSKDSEETAGHTDGFYCADAKILADDIYALVGDNRKLKDFVDAVLLFGKHKREDIAEILGISPQEVTNLKRELQRIQALKPLLKGATSRKG